MKQTLILTIACLLLCSRALATDWKEEKGDHFIVYYRQDGAAAKEVLRKSEFCYNKVASDLGYARYSNFWQWDKRVKIYLHASLEDFQKATGQPQWSHGMASYFDKTIHSFETNDHFLNGVLPHEITHLIFRDFVGLKSQVPLWMDEGVAQWEEDEKRQQALQVMPKMVATGDTYTLETLTTMDVRRETVPAAVGMFYLQSISVIDFLITKYGPSAFTVFCRELRDGKPFEVALRSAYPSTVRSVEELDDKWRTYVLSMRVPEHEQENL